MSNDNLLFKGHDGRDYRTPEALASADSAWREATYRLIPQNNTHIKETRNDEIVQEPLPFTRQPNTP